jgi:hypothetical protein
LVSIIKLVGRSGRRVLALAVAAGICGTATYLVFAIQTSKNPVNSATVLGAEIAAATLAITVLLPLGAWWQSNCLQQSPQASTPMQVNAAADKLGEETAERWREEAGRRRIVTPAPVMVRWQWVATAADRHDVAVASVPGVSPPTLPGSGRLGKLLRSLPGRERILGSGEVVLLHDDLYARLPHGRLVLIGAPGSGKTGAMILLLLAALGQRADLTDDLRSRVPVPVWLTLGRWDPVKTPLRVWAAERMQLDHPALRSRAYGPSAADDLIRAGRVALFLDGLDEMPAEARPEALRRINEETGRLRVVLTSRSEEFYADMNATPVDNAAVVELLPVRAAEAGAYLLRGQSGSRRRQWKDLAEQLKRDPGGSAAQALSNPLTLSMVRDAYKARDPSELADRAAFPRPADLREHLIRHVLVSAYPDEDQRVHATRYLVWLADHMGSSRDLLWWDISGWIPRWRLRLAGSLAITVMVGISFVLTLGFAYGVLGSLIIGITVSPLIGSSSGARPVALHWPGLREYRRVLRSWLRLAGGFLAALILVSVAGYFGVSFAVISGLIILTAYEFRILWTAEADANAPSATSAGTYRADRLAGLSTGLLAGTAVLVECGLLFEGSSDGFGSWLVSNLEFSAPLALVAAFIASLSIAQVPRLKLAELFLSWRYRDRIRFLRLLEEAVDLQVLRQAGVVYQFRHAALQDYLAASQKRAGPEGAVRRLE